MRVLDSPAAAEAAARNGWAARRDWQAGNEFVGYRQCDDDSRAFALVDQRIRADGPADVTHSASRMDEVHVGRLCTSAGRPHSTMVVGHGRDHGRRGDAVTRTVVVPTYGRLSFTGIGLLFLAVSARALAFAKERRSAHR